MPDTRRGSHLFIYTLINSTISAISTIFPVHYSTSESRQRKESLTYEFESSNIVQTGERVVKEPEGEFDCSSLEVEGMLRLTTLCFMHLYSDLLQICHL
jgi:hypothetical protein